MQFVVYKKERRATYHGEVHKGWVEVTAIGSSLTQIETQMVVRVARVMAQDDTINTFTLPAPQNNVRIERGC